jgi:hypothetical protein
MAPAPLSTAAIHVAYHTIRWIAEGVVDPVTHATGRTTAHAGDAKQDDSQGTLQSHELEPLRLLCGCGLYRIILAG